MALSRKEIGELLRSVSLTRSDEVTCDECLKRLAEFAERCLEGNSIPDGLQTIEHHLAICTECKEEYEALLAAMKNAG